MTKLLNRDDIIKAKDIRVEKVDMEPYGWGGYVYVRGMTGLERGQFEYDMQAVRGPIREENQKRFRAKILVNCVVDAEVDGQKLFREQDVDSVSLSIWTIWLMWPRGFLGTGTQMWRI